jgi:dTMP kinase
MGALIVLEGGDASGKSTQARLLADRLRSRDRDVVETFEPGATQTGAAIRAVLLDGDEPIDATTEALLLAADRAQEVAEVIRPALARGADVVSDRFVPSSLAYQGVGRGLGVEKVEKLNRWATGDLEPDVIIVLDVDDAVATSRRDAPGDRLERAGAEFHATVREAYRTLGADRGWVVLDGNDDAEVVSARVWEVVRERLGL